MAGIPENILKNPPARRSRGARFPLFRANKAPGIGQINTTVGRFDQVRKSDAAGVKESYAVAEELHKQENILDSHFGRFQIFMLVPKPLSGCASLARAARLSVWWAVLFMLFYAKLRFDTLTILEAINLQVHLGQHVCLLGWNGAGKSTS